MRIERDDTGRKLAFTANEAKAFKTVKGLCDDLSDLKVEGAAEVGEKLGELMTALSIGEEAAPAADDGAQTPA